MGSQVSVVEGKKIKTRLGTNPTIHHSPCGTTTHPTVIPATRSPMSHTRLYRGSQSTKGKRLFPNSRRSLPLGVTSLIHWVTEGSTSMYGSASWAVAMLSPLVTLSWCRSVLSFIGIRRIFSPTNASASFGLVISAGGWEGG